MVIKIAECHFITPFLFLLPLNKNSNIMYPIS
uniref:Uncharacterized protein n=1 Tax=Myoviridae sp. ctIty1 TaxID=2827673 RepID=A0A8S5THM4_9CAUD|nr:MAG TPA: hypothetical protein [Myoviridae sp. ctIty1]